jgi:hypothetical protein
MSDAYADYEVTVPVWGDDGELIEKWFAEGDRIDYHKMDWIYWVDLYKEHVDRTDLVVHWLRCLFDPELPRPSQLGAT